MERFYVARSMYVTQREEEIQKWTALSREGKISADCPAAIQEGQRFSKVFQLPDKSIFWQRGVTVNESGQRVGRGMLNLELLLVDSAGWDLSKNPYALNETIRVLFRTIIPFLILFIVGCITKPDEKDQLDRFFVKMKTQVVPDRVIDEKELALSYAQPDRYDHTKLFPVSNWEFDKWNKEDAIGFLLSCLVAGGIVGTLFFLVSLGS